MNDTPHLLNISRRGFVAGLGIASGALVLGLPLTRRAQAATSEAAHFGAMLTIARDGVASLVIPSTEMGQGTHEALARMVAEELECDWNAMQVELPWADPAFQNPLARKQITANSMTVIGYYTAMRTLGAATRSMLVTAASSRLGVPASELTVANGTISHAASGRTVSFGDVAEAASQLAVPSEVALKPASEFTIIGSGSLRKDLRPKVTGEAEFGIDVAQDGMLIGVPVLATHPKAEVTLEGIDAARAMPGIEAIVPVSNGVVVVGTTYWRAKKAAESLTLTVASSPIAELDDATIRARLIAGFDTVEPKGFPQIDMSSFPPRPIPAEPGALEAAFAQADRIIEAEYEVPYLAHATMEPICCAARVDPGHLFVRGPLQDPESSRKVGAAITGLPLEDVRVEVTYAGGGFGRKWGTDFVAVAIEAAQGVPGRLIKTIWPREMDMAGDQYRPAHIARSRAAIASDGTVTALHSRIAGQSIMAYHGRKGPPGLENLADASAAGQLIYSDYRGPHQKIEFHEVDLQVPIGFWRSVSMSMNAFFQEAFIDEIARQTGQDPLQLRLTLLQGHPRITPVLKRAAEMIGLDTPRPEGVGRGIAFSYSTGNYCAIGVEVGLDDTNLTLKRIACAADCGRMIDPAGVEAQVSGGIVFGLQAALWGEVHFEEGKPTAQNFADYRLPMMADIPPIAIDLLPGSDEPGTIGEASTPVIAPAIVNAILDAGGPHVRSLPISRTLSI